MGGDVTTISVSREKMVKLDDLLQQYCTQAKTVWAILLTKAGHLITQRGFVASFDVLAIGALACGVFNSTSELARIIGERQFNEFLQEGRRTSIYYISLNEHFLMVSLYDERTLPGLVKVASEEFVTAANEILKDAR